MNKIILMGRLTRDPEVRYSQGANQTAVARFSLAVDRRFKREEEPEADFFNCTTFNKQAEFAEKYLRQGIKVVITGRVQNDNYTNKEGEKVHAVQVIVEEIEFAESKNAAGAAGQSGGHPSVSQAAGDGFMSIPEGAEEELPFN
jgi:single-strand DNA-binding protein